MAINTGFLLSFAISQCGFALAAAGFRQVGFVASLIGTVGVAMLYGFMRGAACNSPKSRVKTQ